LEPVVAIFVDPPEPAKDPTVKTFRFGGGIVETCPLSEREKERKEFRTFFVFLPHSRVDEERSHGGSQIPFPGRRVFMLLTTRSATIDSVTGVMRSAVAGLVSVAAVGAW